MLGFDPNSLVVYFIVWKLVLKEMEHGVSFNDVSQKERRTHHESIRLL